MLNTNYQIVLLILYIFQEKFNNFCSEELRLTIYFQGKPLSSTANAQNRQDNQQSIDKDLIQRTKLAVIASYPGNPPAYASFIVYHSL